MTMQDWFREAKLGIFIHWGIYAVRGIPESWSFFNGEISYADYMAQARGFHARRYDPEAWAALFAAAGARYAVLTAKHHDGFALWPSAVSRLNAQDGSPAGRDLIGPYVEAMRARGLHPGLYFSHLDWSHPDYPSVRHPAWGAGGGPYSAPQDGRGEDPAAWQRFLAFHRAQLRELCTRYRPDLLWFDGDWERSGEQWDMPRLRRELHRWNPGVVLNSRMDGHGDYETPEQGLPVARPRPPWEFCTTINDSWGYQKGDRAHKTTRQLIRLFSEVIGGGGNLLLGLGPRADGSFLAVHERRLRELGAWIARHAEAIYPTRAGLPEGHFHGPTTLSADGRSLYCFALDRVPDQLMLKGIHTPVRRARVLGAEGELTHRVTGGAPWMDIPGTLWVDLPTAAQDRRGTVVCLEFAEPVALYRGAGGAITAN